MLLKFIFANRLAVVNSYDFILKTNSTDLPKIIFTVTNDLSFDQRMHRIAGCLAENGYQVMLVGVKRADSIKLQKRSFTQYRLPCFAQNGPLFYIEYNFRLLVYLLFAKTDIICAIDLDTILPCLFAAKLRKKKRVYDAHEYFTEQKEVRTRPNILRIWKLIEVFAVPKFPKGYTVNSKLAQLFYENHGVEYQIIRNVSIKYLLENTDIHPTNKFILYQGAVNEGRCFEELIPAMKWVNATLIIVGNGNFFSQAEALIRYFKLTHKIILRGSIPPDELRQLTQEAYIGVTLFESNGINQYYSLANRFFDYMMAGTPQICVNYPLYQEINQEHGFAYLIDNTHPLTIGDALNKLLEDDVLYTLLKQNCIKARNLLNWENESHQLIEFYSQL